MEIISTPVGYVTSSRAEPYDDGWDDEVATITLDGDRFDAEALQGLDRFTHAEIVYHFDRASIAGTVHGARHPRGNSDWPQVGIFAQRAKNRPNRIGTTIVRVVGVSGLTLTVAGLDAVDGTPVIDIKPYMTEFGPRGPVHQPAWATELMQGYWTR